MLTPPRVSTLTTPSAAWTGRGEPYTGKSLGDYFPEYRLCMDLMTVFRASSVHQRARTGL